MISLIGVKDSGERYIMYDYNPDRYIPKNTIGYTTLELSKEQLEEIKNCTSDEIQKILYNYFVIG